MKNGVEFPEVEELLVKYLKLRAYNYKQDKCGVTWETLTAKSLEFATKCGIDADTFAASPGWISKVLKQDGERFGHFYQPGTFKRF